MNFYQVNLIVWAVANACSLILRRRTENSKMCYHGIQDEQKEVAAVQFQRKFLLVYTLVVAADWLQVCKQKHQSSGPLLVVLIRAAIHRGHTPTLYTGTKSSWQNTQLLFYMPSVSFQVLPAPFLPDSSQIVTEDAVHVLPTVSATGLHVWLC
jgi:hypothetical protein